MTTRFLWDDRPGRNVGHIAVHGMTTDMWESVYRRAQRRAPDQEDPTVTVAEGRVHGRAYRIIYATLDDGCIVPMTIFPITGFPIERRGLH